jgi:hypothetical protein
MTFLATFSLAEAESAEAALAAAGIFFERRIVEENELEYAELSVNDADYERALTALDANEAPENAEISLEKVSHCPHCTGMRFAWFAHETNEGMVELLFCECAGDQPVAYRNLKTKLGRILLAPGVGS